MKKPFVDFHTHTVRSDGQLTPDELILAAKKAGIGVLAITDHNMLCHDIDELQARHPDIRLIQGTEISCMYGETEVHVIGLNVNRNNERLIKTLEQNNENRRVYIDAILARLRDCGIDIGSYEDVCACSPDSKRPGRMHVAKALLSKGYVGSIDEAFDEYVGGFGKKRAFVQNPTRYISMEQAISAIKQAGGIPVLCHLYYYNLFPADAETLVSTFKELAQDNAAMEVAYSRYDKRQRAELCYLANKYGLLPSAASDYHGFEDTATLDNAFPYEIYERLFSL